MLPKQRPCPLAVLLLAAVVVCGGRTVLAVGLQEKNFATVELDARSENWHSLRRQALLAGRFLPPYRPVTLGEITDILDGAGAGAERTARSRLSRGLWRHAGCACDDDPMHLRLAGRLALLECGPGNVVEGEAGLRGQGLIVSIEPELTVARGRFWVAVAPRLNGPLSRRRPQVPDALIYRRWPLPTGRPATGAARRESGDWNLALPRAATGVRLGRWSLTAGLFPATIGSGLDGDGLTLTSQAESLPQIVLRRTAPLRWSGPLRSLAPAHVLVRAGYTSAQTLGYSTEWGSEEHRTTPVFCQWLLTWNHTPWWRTTVAHAAMAAARKGETLWAYWPQVNFPRLGATWSEKDYGPITDRLFSLIMEWRFRDAPWPFMPSAAGRLWWEYGGEDYRPHDTLPFMPDIAAPASLAGLELVDPRWDLGLQYMETRHPSVLWYSNSSYPHGYTHHGVLLGHPLGGGVEAWTALVRLRTGAAKAGVQTNADRATTTGSEFELRGRTATWQGVQGQSAAARRDDLTLGWRNLADGPAAWVATVGWVREQVDTARATWLTASLGRSF